MKCTCKQSHVEWVFEYSPEFAIGDDSCRIRKTFWSGLMRMRRNPGSR